MSRRQDRFANYGATEEKAIHVPLSQRHREHALRHPNCKRSQEIVKDLDRVLEVLLS